MLDVILIVYETVTASISSRRTAPLQQYSMEGSALPIASPVWFFSVSGSRDSLRYCFITKKAIHMKLNTHQQIMLHKLCIKFQTSSSTLLKNMTM